MGTTQLPFSDAVFTNVYSANFTVSIACSRKADSIMY
jgi:hypothetical protein